MGERSEETKRDPQARKRRDLARQRKIASNSSDKAARRHARTIKAMENRKIRRNDKQDLTPDLEDAAEQLKHQHRIKNRHWGTDHAATRREANREAQAKYQKHGGRRAVQAQQIQAFLQRTDNAALAALLNDTLARLAARKKIKG